MWGKPDGAAVLSYSCDQGVVNSQLSDYEQHLCYHLSMRKLLSSATTYLYPLWKVEHYLIV